MSIQLYIVTDRFIRIDLIDLARVLHGTVFQYNNSW